MELVVGAFLILPLLGALAVPWVAAGGLAAAVIAERFEAARRTSRCPKPCVIAPTVTVTKAPPPAACA
mgnify:CR=1 FL=1